MHGPKKTKYKKIVDYMCEKVGFLTVKLGGTYRYNTGLEMGIYLADTFTELLNATPS